MNNHTSIILKPILNISVFGKNVKVNIDTRRNRNLECTNLLKIMKLYAEDPFSSFQNKALAQITLCQTLFFFLKTCVSLPHTYWSNYLIICLLQQTIISRKQRFCLFVLTLVPQT